MLYIVLPNLLILNTPPLFQGEGIPQCKYINYF